MGGYFPIGPKTRALVSGVDSQRYLNGQLSNSVQRADSATAIQALLLTAKGRLCAVVNFWKTDQGFLLETDPSLAEEFFPRLERYIVSDDVTVEDVSSLPTGWHVFGPAANHFPDALKISRLGEIGRDLESRPSLDIGMEATPEELEILRIERGIPAWGRELTPETLPHEAGLDRTAVDFHKGCYVGQEVVSRLESVGHANRLLHGFTGDFPARPGLTVITQDGRTAGTLTSATQHFGLALTAALGYVNTRISDNHFLVHNDSGTPLGKCQRHEFPLV